jgi:exodeoxyribonuclease V gamma subunit
MAEPLPVAARTALAFVADASQAAAVYDGGFAPGEAADACLARTYPDFEALVADGRFERLAEQLYGPMARWIGHSVAVTRHDTAGDGNE